MRTICVESEPGVSFMREKCSYTLGGTLTFFTKIPTLSYLERGIQKPNYAAHLFFNPNFYKQGGGR